MRKRRHNHAAGPGASTGSVALGSRSGRPAHEIKLACQAYDGSDRGKAGREHQRGEGATTAHADAEDQGGQCAGFVADSALEERVKSEPVSEKWVIPDDSGR